MKVRPAAVAGMFYPGDPDELRALIDRQLDAAPDDAGPAPKAVIAPHAGYVYSGPVAASVYGRLRRARGTVRRVVLLGPAHRVPVEGMAVPGVDAFETPLGPVSIDRANRDLALSLPAVTVDDRAHAAEHSLEVHLPFLLRVLGSDIEVLPVVVGEARTTDVARLLDALWGGPETLIVASSDLSHYHDHVSARARDNATAQAIVDKRLEDVGPYDACGAYPVRGLLEAARTHGLEVTLLDLRNSGDTGGDRSRVVGYGAFALT